MTTQILRGGAGNFSAARNRAAEAGHKGGQARGGNVKMIPEEETRRAVKEAR